MGKGQKEEEEKEEGPGPPRRWLWFAQPQRDPGGGGGPPHPRPAAVRADNRPPGAGHGLNSPCSSTRNGRLGSHLFSQSIFCLPFFRGFSCRDPRRGRRNKGPIVQLV